MWPGRKLCAGRRSPDIAGVGAGGDRSTGRDHDEPPRRRERPADSVVGGTAHGAGLANAAGGQTSRSPGEYSPPPVKTSCRKAKPNSTAGPLPFSSGCSPLGWCCQNWAAAISPAAMKAAMRVNNPTKISRPKTSSIRKPARTARCQPARCPCRRARRTAWVHHGRRTGNPRRCEDAQSCGRVGVESSVQTGRHGPTTLRGQEIRNSSSTAAGPSLTSSTCR